MAWRALRSVEWLVGVAADSVARPFLAPGRRGRVDGAARGGIWIHAASMGESAAVAPLVAELDGRGAGPIYATATTAAGAARLRATLGETRAGLAPLDAPSAAQRFVRALTPGLALLVETELWPRWLETLDRHRVPVAVVSGRLSARSVRGYARLGGGFRRLLRTLVRVEAQSEEDAARWREAGVPPERVGVSGNLKVDAIAVAPANRSPARARLGLDLNRPLLVVGSVRPGEATVLARAWGAVPLPLRRGWQVVLVPRHPRARRRIEDELRRKHGTPVPSELWSVDARLGVLADYYAAADLAFVGGSLLDYGGHNPLEPAALGVPALMGPDVRAQAPAARALAASGGLVIVDGEAGLTEALGRLLGSPAERERRGRAASDAVRALQGVAGRTAETLARHGLLPGR